MASPSFDNAMTFTMSGWVNGTSISHAATVQTSGSNELVVAFIGYENSTDTVSSVTESSNTLTFVFLAKVRNTTAGQRDQTTEVWVAPATSQYNPGAGVNSFVVNWGGGGGNVDDAVITFTALIGVHSLTLPLDPNASIPASAFNSTNTVPPALTFSTSNPDDLLVGIVSRGNCCGGPVTPTGWSNFANNGTAAGLNGEVLSIDYQSVSATQSGVNYTNASTTNDDTWCTMVLAFTADASGGGGGNPSKAACVLTGF